MTDAATSEAGAGEVPSRDDRPEALEPALDRLRLEGSVYCLFEGGDAYGLRLPEAPAARFHAVREGACWLRVEDDEPLRVGAGELVLLPGGERHDVLADPASEVVDVQRAFGGAEPDEKVFRLGDGRPTASLICGGFEFQGERYPVQDCLPRLIRLRVDQPGGEMLTGLLDIAESELRSAHLASDVVLGRLSEILFVAAVRTYMESLPPGSRGWLGAVRDRATGAALAAIHRAPQADWSVEKLARHAGVSSTTLNDRFRRFLDDTPSRYLRRWRMLVAGDLLRHTELGMAQIADRVGYASEAAFSRAFRRELGRWPTEHRSGPPKGAGATS